MTLFGVYSNAGENVIAYGRNHLIFRFVSAARPYLKLKSLTFLGQKNEIIRTETFFTQPFATVHFPASTN